MEAKGRKLLKVCGVIFIIEGIMGIVVYGLLTLVLGLGLAINGYVSGGFSVTAIAAMYTISAIIALIAGILGVKHASDRAAAGKCLVWGVLNLILTVIAGIWSIIDGGVTAVHVLYTCIGFIIPSLYIAGAYVNKE